MHVASGGAEGLIPGLRFLGLSCGGSLVVFVVIVGFVAVVVMLFCFGSLVLFWLGKEKHE